MRIQERRLRQLIREVLLREDEETPKKFTHRFEAADADKVINEMKNAPVGSWFYVSDHGDPFYSKINKKDNNTFVTSMLLSQDDLKAQLTEQGQKKVDNFINRSDVKGRELQLTVKDFSPDFSVIAGSDGYLTYLLMPDGTFQDRTTFNAAIFDKIIQTTRDAVAGGLTLHIFYSPTWKNDYAPELM